MDDIDIEEIRPAMTWKLRQEVLYPNQKQYEMEFDNDLDDTHFGAFSDAGLVAVVSVGKNKNDFQLRDFAIDPSAQNTGAGEALVESITEYAKKQGGTHLWTDSSMDQLPLYLKYDFVQTGRYYSRHGVDYEIVEKPI